MHGRQEAFVNEGSALADGRRPTQQYSHVVDVRNHWATRGQPVERIKKSSCVGRACTAPLIQDHWRVDDFPHDEQ
jgi:hypothetical protein